MKAEARKKGKENCLNLIQFKQTTEKNQKRIIQFDRGHAPAPAPAPLGGKSRQGRGRAGRWGWRRQRPLLPTAETNPKIQLGIEPHVTQTIKSVNNRYLTASRGFASGAPPLGLRLGGRHRGRHQGRRFQLAARLTPSPKGKM